MDLCSKKQWRKNWSKQKRNSLSFDPDKPLFREQHKLFNKYIPQDQHGHMLEVGAYPGTYLRYFYDYFGYKPSGVEYVKSCASEAAKLLKKEGVPGTILHRDFFTMDLNDSPAKEGWDLTVSFGFVEHFEDSTDAVAKHIELTRYGGLIIISIPNHAGFNGWILKRIDKEKWKQHNKMSLRSLVDAVQRSGKNEVLYSGYVGHIGFWNTGLYSLIHKRYRKLYPFVRAPLWLIESLGQWCVPNNRWTSPNSLVILRKNKDEAK
ncbi:MAG: class I SAM-dependent methyltransferase [Alphaproteobacteria bacterium]|nr:class I SAM-dependent methyltransferase [Alphaproteobacteria bacterium]